MSQVPKMLATIDTSRFHSYGKSLAADERTVVSTVPKVLHTLMLGTMKYTLLSLFNFKIVTVSTHTNSSTGYITSTTKVSKPLMVDKIERRIRVLSMHSKRQSVRDMP